MKRTREQWVSLCRCVSSGFIPSTGRATLYDSGVEYVKTFLEPSGALGGNDRVVDVGCGNGRLAMGLTERRGVQYLGLDVVRESVDFCAAAFEGLPGFKFAHLDVRNSRYNPAGKQDGARMTLPLPDGWATLVVASSLFTHIANPLVTKRYLSEMRRVLEPGGKMLTTWFANPPNRLSGNEARVVRRQSDIEALLEPDEVVWQHGGETTEHHDQWMLLTRVA